MTDEIPHVIVEIGTPAVTGHALLEAAAAASLTLDLNQTLVGDAHAITRLLATMPHDAERVRILDAPQSGIPDLQGRETGPQTFGAALQRALVDMQQRPGSVLVTCSDADAVLAATQATLGRLIADIPPALVAVLPTVGAREPDAAPYSFLLDVGAGTDADGATLAAWARYGAAYAASIARIRQPVVALLSTTTRVDLVSPALHDALRLLQATPGNPEVLGLLQPNRLLAAQADVLVCKGTVGASILQTLQGLTETADQLVAQARARLQWRVGVSMLHSGLDLLRQRTNWENYGGQTLLGCRGLAVLPQLDASPRACASAIRLAGKLQRQDTLRRLQDTAALLPPSA